jgi:uncharacterized protein YjbI with pentapeptide repeats
MADKNLVDMIRRSVSEFNTWRKNKREKNPEAQIDLSGADLSIINLDGIDFFNCILERANLRTTSLQNVNFTRASLTDATLVKARLSGAKFDSACVAGADFTDADLTRVTLRGVEGLETACFYNAIVEPKAQKIILAAVAESMRDPKPHRGE